MNRFTALKSAVVAGLLLLTVPPIWMLARPTTPPRTKSDQRATRIDADGVSPMDQAKAERPPRVAPPAFDFSGALKEIGGAITAPGWVPGSQNGLSPTPVVRSVDVEAFISGTPALTLARSWLDAWPTRTAPQLDGKLRLVRILPISAPFAGVALELKPENATGTEFDWRAVWLLPLRPDDISRFRQNFADGLMRDMVLQFGRGGNDVNGRPAIVFHGNQGLAYVAVFWAAPVIAFGSESFTQALATSAPARAAAGTSAASLNVASQPPGAELTDAVSQWRNAQGPFQQRQRDLETSMRRFEAMPNGEEKTKRLREVADRADALKREWDQWKRENPAPQ